MSVVIFVVVAFVVLKIVLSFTPGAQAKKLEELDKKVHDLKFSCSWREEKMAELDENCIHFRVHQEAYHKATSELAKVLNQIEQQKHNVSADVLSEYNRRQSVREKVSNLEVEMLSLKKQWVREPDGSVQKKQMYADCSRMESELKQLKSQNASLFKES